MKKLSVVIAMIVLASCGQNQTKLEFVENQKVVLEESKYYPVTVIKCPRTSELFGAMLHVPEGFTLDRKHYEESGDMVFPYKDKIAAFAIKFKTNPGLYDAATYVEMNVVKPNDKAFSFGKLESVDNWSVPMPTLEDLESCQASHARISYDRQVENTVLTGSYYVWWFVIPKIKTIPGSSFAIVISQECKKEDWNKIGPMFEMMRQTLFRLPSRSEAKIYEQFAPKDSTLPQSGILKVNERLFKLENGESPAPGWDTLIGKYMFAADNDKMEMFLVPKMETPSGLLPHPTIPGWTVDPRIGVWLTDYLELPEEPKIKIPTLKMP